MAPELFIPAPTGPGQRPADNSSDVEVQTKVHGPIRPRVKSRNQPRITPLPINITRWMQADIEDALQAAASGSMTRVAQLHRAFGRDGFVKGLFETRYGGLLRLPRQVTGDPQCIQAMVGQEGRPGLFDTYFPPAELKKLAEDGESCGIGVGEFIIGENARPSLVRLDPEFLTYRWNEDTWYYRTLKGLQPITPGDGHWVLHTPHGRYEPWNHGDWQSIGRAYVSKEHAILFRENWITKFASPARVGVAPQGASEEQKNSWFQKIAGWGANQVFMMTPGYEVKMLEVQGQRGIQAFQDAINDANVTFMIIICGQTMTVDGGVGFSNSGVGITVRADLIQQSGNSLAATLNAQAMPFVAWDISDGRTNDLAVAWDTRPPQDLKAGAESLTAAAEAIEKSAEVLSKVQEEHPGDTVLVVDVRTLVNRYGIPTIELSSPPAPKPTPGPQRTIAGIEVAIDFPKGSTRSGVSPDGTPWSTTMLVDYGHLPGIMGMDGDPVDVYAGPNDQAQQAFVVHQPEPDKELKVMLGYDSEEEARQSLLQHAPEWTVGPIEMIPVSRLMTWLRLGGESPPPTYASARKMQARVVKKAPGSKKTSRSVKEKKKSHE